MLEDIRLAFQGIWNHKLRSALTMLGIIIGIGSIIAIVSTIKGTNEQIKKNLVGAGNDAVNVQLYQGGQSICSISHSRTECRRSQTRHCRKSLNSRKWRQRLYIIQEMNTTQFTAAQSH